MFGQEDQFRYIHIYIFDPENQFGYFCRAEACKYFTG